MLKILNRIPCLAGQSESEEGAGRGRDSRRKEKKAKNFSELQAKGQKGGGSNGNGAEGPTHSLSQRQVFSLKQSWKGVMREETSFAVEMFIKLFKTNSGLQTMFQGFKDICTDDELRSNEALEYHATLVMSTLDDAITHIDNYDFVRQLLHRTGASHIRFPNFQPENFYAIKEPFLEAVRVTLGDRYTENMENIYSVAITFILDTLVQGMKEAVGKVGEEGTGTNGSA